MPYDNYTISFKIFISIIYSFSSLILIYPEKNYAAFTISLFLVLNIIFSIIIFNFSLSFWIIFIIQIILLILSIILIAKINGRSEQKGHLDLLFYIIFCTVSGFLFGDELVEIITLYSKVLLNYQRWLIISGSSVIFNFLIIFDYIFCDNIGFMISSSFSFAYFISNIALIGFEKKIPIDTIINSLIKEGFDISYMEMFRNPGYYIYFIIYLILFLVNIIFKSIWLCCNNKK